MSLSIGNKSKNILFLKSAAFFLVKLGDFVASVNMI